VEPKITPKTDLCLVEFHCHTIYSKDSLTLPAQLIESCRRKGIDRVVITDHNTIAGAKTAQKMAPELVIVGEEIMTQGGELLAAFVQEEIPPGLPAVKTIDILRDQDAFISVSHPFDRFRSGHWRLSELQEISTLVDAIEIFNARCFPGKFNRLAKEFASQNNLAGTVGSDAHAVSELGTAVQFLRPFTSAAELKSAIWGAIYVTNLSPPWVRLNSRYAVVRKKMGSYKLQ